MHNHSIAHMDLDSFFVSVERLKNSSLLNKPVIIGGGSQRGVVASCSYEARAFGVHSAMPTRLARQLCPQAILIRGDMEDYSRYSSLVTDVIKDNVPLYEKSSIDEFYIDLTGMDRFFGCYHWATELRQKIIKQTGLPISLGFSNSKTVSKIATGEAKPSGQKKIDFGTEKCFLAPLSIKKIPMVGEKTYRLLRGMGIEKIETLQQMPVELLERAMGVNGTAIWKKANGIDNTPVQPYSERKSISAENTFEEDTIDIKKLQATIVAMAEKIAFSLRKKEKLTSCITVKIRYSDFDTHTLQAHIPYTSCDHIIIEKAKELFEKVYQRRMLIRLVGVRASSLIHGGYQINLFEDTQEMISLYQAMDKIRLRYGATAVKRAIGMNTHFADINPFGKE
jgi:DNA polymerase IV